MKTSSLKVPILIAICIFLIGPKCFAGVASETIEETTQIVLRKFSKEVGEETAQTLSGKIAKVSADYGTDGLVAVQKVGPRSFQIISDAGSHGGQAVKLMAKHGDAAVWVIGKPKGMAIFIKYGSEAAETAITHKGVAEPLIDSFGGNAVSALKVLSPQNGRRLAMLANESTIKAGADSEKLLSVMARYGDKGMDFIWRNKGALAVGTTLSAFLANPEPFINGVQHLGSDVVNKTGDTIGKNTNWTLVFVFGLILAAIIVMLRMALRKHSRTRTS